MPSARTLIDTARAHLQADRLVEAEQSYRAALAAEPNNAGALHGLGMVHHKAGRHADALELIGRAITGNDRIGLYHSDLGLALLALGRREEGIACQWHALERDRDLLQAHFVLTEILLPGEHYHEVLGRLHEWLRPRVYLEIGTEVGNSMALVRPPTVAVGIDPMPKIQRAFAVEPKIFAMTSDDFFASTDLAAVTGAPVFDLAFIDGMHTFDQALRDFINIEKLAHAKSVVLVHDCVPLSAPTATREQETCFWSGDTWRLIPLLKRHRPDLTIRTIPCRPTGLALITGLDPASKRLDADYDALVAEFIALSFDYLSQDRDDKLGVIANDWPVLEQHLRQALGPIGHAATP